ncbi:hypothetical protein BurJ1DRAFT_4105 [Burkholderiales bacterium JOSHI_001]|nr:hypothetical protein BurJ1DRAFT_4105 [Burkholderiales bacterium JOSHI_001]
MRAAPPVAVSLGDARRERRVVALLAAASAAALALWVLDHGFDLLELAWRLAIAVLAAGLGLACGGWLWPRQAGALRWDGAAWQRVSADGSEHSVRVRLMIDADAWILLRCRAASGLGPAQWLGLWRDQTGPAWSALRAALYWPVPDAAAAAPKPSQHPPA